VSPRSWRQRGTAAAAGAALLALCLQGVATAAEVRDFDTPQAAAQAMVEALGNDDLEAVLSLLDRDFEQQLLGGDEAEARANMRDRYQAALEFWGLRSDGDDRWIMLVGAQVWPVPFPIVRVESRWRFDTAQGIEEMVNRRIGRNERRAIEVARAYLFAQQEYAAADRDGDQVREYATRIHSRPGMRDGLYWDANDDEPVSPFGPLVAEAFADMPGRGAGDPYYGYYFKVLTRQGANPPGGAYDYVINGNMIAGFALLAFPADYGNSGIMTFLVSHQGRIVQKDLGEDTALITNVMQHYDPDASWAALDE
jgi:hypothetical protein